MKKTTKHTTYYKYLENSIYDIIHNIYFFKNILQLNVNITMPSYSHSSLKSILMNRLNRQGVKTLQSQNTSFSHFNIDENDDMQLIKSEI